MVGSSPKNPDADTIRDVMLAPFIHRHALAEQTVVGLLKIYIHKPSQEGEEEVLFGFTAIGPLPSSILLERDCTLSLSGELATVIALPAC